jgi:TPR repeat protein
MADEVERFIEAVIRLRTSARAGNSVDQMTYAYCLAQGKGAARDPAQAAGYYRMAAEQGIAEAMFTCGVCLLLDETNKDAAELFRRASDLGHLPSTVNLAYCLATGRGGCEANLDEAFALFRSAAERGDPMAEFNLGIASYLGQCVEKDTAEAERYFQVAASHGNPAAQSNCGYLLGSGRQPKDRAGAVAQFELSAQQDHTVGMFNYGYSLVNAMGVARDAKKGADFLLRAADRDYLPAMVNYGKCLLNGEGVKADLRAASRYLARPKSPGDRFFTFQLIDYFCAEERLPKPVDLDPLLLEGPLSELQLAFHTFEVVSELGPTAKRLRRKWDGNEYVVKSFPPDAKPAFVAELRAAMTVRHPCLLEIAGFQMLDDGSFAIGHRFLPSLSEAAVKARGSSPPDY